MNRRNVLTKALGLCGLGTAAQGMILPELLTGDIHFEFGVNENITFSVKYSYDDAGFHYGKEIRCKLCEGLMRPEHDKNLAEVQKMVEVSNKKYDPNKLTILINS